MLNLNRNKNREFKLYLAIRFVGTSSYNVSKLRRVGIDGIKETGQISVAVGRH